MWLSKKGHDVTGLELYAPNVPYVKERTIIGDATDMQFEDNSFDLVYCTEMFEHVTKEDTDKILKEMKREVPEGIFSVMPNAGWPEQIGGRIMYPANQDYFGEYTVALCQAGASVIGGCCGTTPEHIRQLAVACAELSPAIREVTL